MYFIFFFGGGFFLLSQRFLGIFLVLGHFNIGVLNFCSTFTFVSCFFVFSSDMSVLLGRVDQESSHDTSMVTSHVDHVVGLSVLHIPQVSSLGQNVINLFFFSLWRDEGRLFLRRFLNIVLSAE